MSGPWRLRAEPGWKGLRGIRPSGVQRKHSTHRAVWGSRRAGQLPGCPQDQPVSPARSSHLCPAHLFPRPGPQAQPAPHTVPTDKAGERLRPSHAQGPRSLPHLVHTVPGAQGWGGAGREGEERNLAAGTGRWSPTPGCSQQQTKQEVPGALAGWGLQWPQVQPPAPSGAQPSLPENSAKAAKCRDQGLSREKGAGVCSSPGDSAQGGLNPEGRAGLPGHRAGQAPPGHPRATSELSPAHHHTSSPLQGPNPFLQGSKPRQAPASAGAHARGLQLGQGHLLTKEPPPKTRHIPGGLKPCQDLTCLDPGQKHEKQAGRGGGHTEGCPLPSWAESAGGPGGPPGSFPGGPEPTDRSCACCGRHLLDATYVTQLWTKTNAFQSSIGKCRRRTNKRNL